MKKTLTMTALALALSSPVAFAQSANTTQNGTNHSGVGTQTSPSTTPNTGVTGSDMNKSSTTSTTTTTTTNKSLDHNSSKSDQDKWWHDRDINNDGKISREEYIQSETKDGDKTVEEAGKEFDEKDKDGTGFIEASEFKAWFERMGDKVSGNK